ncbi:nitroreductase family protein [Pseudomonas sp. PhalM4]
MNVSPKPESGVSGIEALEGVMQQRHSCRAFTSDEVPRDVIHRILAAAQRSPSDCNIQPWKVAIVSGKALEMLRTAMYERALSGSEAAPDVAPIPEYQGVFQDRRRACGWTLYSTLGIERGDRDASYKQAMENFRFFGAPTWQS